MHYKPFFLFALPFVAVLLVGLLGTTRRIGFWLALVLGVVLTPIGGFIVAALSGPKQYKPPKPAPEQKP